MVPRFPRVPSAPSDTCPKASRQFLQRWSHHACWDPSCLPRGARGLACRPATLRKARDLLPSETLQAPPRRAHPNMRFFTTFGCAAWTSPAIIYTKSGGFCQRAVASMSVSRACCEVASATAKLQSRAPEGRGNRDRSNGGGSPGLRGFAVSKAAAGAHQFGQASSVGGQLGRELHLQRFHHILSDLMPAPEGVGVAGE